MSYSLLLLDELSHVCLKQRIGEHWSSITVQIEHDEL